MDCIGQTKSTAYYYCCSYFATIVFIFRVHFNLTCVCRQVNRMSTRLATLASTRWCRQSYQPSVDRWLHRFHPETPPLVCSVFSPSLHLSGLNVDVGWLSGLQIFCSGRLSDNPALLVRTWRLLLCAEELELDYMKFVRVVISIDV